MKNNIVLLPKDNTNKHPLFFRIEKENGSADDPEIIL